MKALIKAQESNINAVYVYNMADSRTIEDAKSHYHLMGLYKRIKGQKPYSQEPNPMAWGFKTTSLLLQSYAYDPKRTLDLKLPESADGVAFKNQAGEYIYALWAKTSQDLSEEANSNYRFPDEMVSSMQELQIYQWNYSQTNQIESTKTNHLTLSSAPCFIKVIN